MTIAASSRAVSELPGTTKRALLAVGIKGLKTLLEFALPVGVTAYISITLALSTMPTHLWASRGCRN